MFIWHGFFVDQLFFFPCNPLNISLVSAGPVDSVLKIRRLKLQACSVPASQPWVFAYTLF